MKSLQISFETVTLSDLQKRYVECKHQLVDARKRADEAEIELNKQILRGKVIEDNLISLIPMIKLNATLKGLGVSPISLIGE